MATLHIEHPITDLPTWMDAFGALADMRRQIGVRTESVRHPIGDDKFIAIDLEFDTVDAARSFLDFLETQVWAKPEHSPALAGTPEARIFEAVDPQPPTVARR